MSGSYFHRKDPLISSTGYAPILFVVGLFSFSAFLDSTPSSTGDPHYSRSLVKSHVPTTNRHTDSGT